MAAASKAAADTLSKGRHSSLLLLYPTKWHRAHCLAAHRQTEIILTSYSLESSWFLIALILVFSGFSGKDSRSLSGILDARELDLVEQLDILALTAAEGTT